MSLPRATHQVMILTDQSEVHNIIFGYFPHQVAVYLESEVDAEAMEAILLRAGYAVHHETVSQ